MTETAKKATVRTSPMRRRRMIGAALTLPLLAFVGMFAAYPLVSSVLTAFQDNTFAGDTTHSYIGFDNFIKLFTRTSFLSSIRFTLIFMTIVVVLELVLGFGLALLINRSFPLKRTLFTLVILPMMVAPALMAIMYRLFLNADLGPFSAILDKLGVQVSLLSPSSVVPLLIVLDIIQWTPFIFLICYGGLQALPGETVEAAKIDGAGGWQMIWSIVIPIMTPIIVAAAFLRAVDAFRTFELIYVLTGGGPGRKTETFSIFIYKTAFSSADFGLASSAALFVLLALVPLAPFVIRRIVRI